MKKRILISGSTGQLGSELRKLSEKNPAFTFVFKNRNEFDLSAPLEISRVLSEPFDYFINAGAYTQVDLAEKNAELCYKINADALTTIAQSAGNSCKIIHVSSDYVYNHHPGRPLHEEDDTLPIGIYAESKLAGERTLMSHRPDSIIIRSSWIYSYFGHNFVKSMIKLGNERNELKVVTDQIGTPTNANDLADVIMKIITYTESNDHEVSGIYNYSNLGTTNWFDFAKEIFKITGIKCEVRPTSTMEYNAPAHRPLWSVLSKEKIIKDFNISIPDWKDSLKDCIYLLNK